jgi:hypothetical protein
MSQTRAIASNPWAIVSAWIPGNETAAVAITTAAMADATTTRSETSRSPAFASVSARYRKYTAARSQMSAIAVCPICNADAARNLSPRMAMIEAAMAKYRTPASASRARAS